MSAAPFLLATLLALAAGPALYALARRDLRALAFLDGFVLVSIAGLVLFEVIPGTYLEGGPWSIAFLLAGLFVPTLLEHLFTRAQRQAHLGAMALAIAGLTLHTLSDGVVLAPDAAANAALPLAVVLHSLPVGMAVWWLLAPMFGPALPALVLAAMGAGTVAGYALGPVLEGALDPQAWAWFQSLVAGTVLHVVLGQPHLHHEGENPEAHHAHESRAPAYEGLGNLAAIGALAVIAAVSASAEAPSQVLLRLQDLALESAPALLVAYLVGGFVYGELPQAVLRWLSSGGRAAQALRGTALGLPLPICSCSVLPLYRSLIGRGVAAPAALAFLIAAPEVGLTALFVSVPLLGLDMTLLRVGTAAVLALLVGYWVGRHAGAARPVFTPVVPAAECCAHGPAQGAGHAHAPAAPRSRLGQALHDGFVTLVDGTAPWIVVGLLMAAVAEPMLSQMMWSQWPDALEVIVFAIIGMPLYVCAAGATPLIAVLIAAGVSPGAALAFLLTGPATNVATFGLLRSMHGARLAWIFSVVTASGAIGLGLAVNALPAPSIPPGLVAHAHHGPVQYLALALLCLLYAASLLRRGARAFIAELADTGAAPLSSRA